MFPFLQIPYGKKGGKDFILKSLTERVNIPFKPVDVSFNNSTFILPLELYTQYSFYSSILYMYYGKWPIFCSLVPLRTRKGCIFCARETRSQCNKKSRQENTTSQWF